MRRIHESVLLVKEAAWSRVPLQDDVVSFSLGKEMSHLQPRRPSSEHTVLKVWFDIVVVVVIKSALDTANQDEKDKTRKARIHYLLNTSQCGKSVSVRWDNIINKY